MPPQTPQEYIQWLIDNGQFGVPAPMPGAGPTMNTLPLPEDQDEWGTLDHTRDALNAFQDLKEVAFSPENTGFRVMNFGTGAIDPSAFDPVMSVTPLSISDMMSLQSQGQVEPALVEGYAEQDSLMGYIARELLAGKGFGAVMAEVARAWEAPDGSEFSELVRAQMPPGYVDSATGEVIDGLDILTSEALKLEQDWMTKSLERQNAPQGMDMASLAEAGMIVQDPVTGQWGTPSYEDSPLTEAYREAGITPPHIPYDPDVLASPEQLAREASIVDDFVANNEAGLARLGELYPDAVQGGVPNAAVRNKPETLDAETESYEKYLEDLERYETQTKPMWDERIDQLEETGQYTPGRWVEERRREGGQGPTTERRWAEPEWNLNDLEGSSGPRGRTRTIGSSIPQGFYERFLSGQMRPQNPYGQQYAGMPGYGNASALAPRTDSLGSFFSQQSYSNPVERVQAEAQARLEARQPYFQAAEEAFQRQAWADWVMRENQSRENSVQRLAEAGYTPGTAQLRGSLSSAGGMGLPFGWG